MIKPNLTLFKANAQKALRMIPNFSMPRELVGYGGSTGSCYVNSRLMMLCCYLIKYEGEGESILLERYSTASIFPKFANEICNADCELIGAAKTYIEECKKPHPDNNFLKAIYLDVASILCQGKASICDESGESDMGRSKSYFKIVQIDNSHCSKINYREIISTLQLVNPTSFIIVVSGHYRGQTFVGQHETLLVNNGGVWILFDDLDCLNDDCIVSGRIV